MPKEKSSLEQPLFEPLEREETSQQKKQNKAAEDPYASLFEDDPQAEIMGPVNTEIIRKRTNKADKYRH